MSAIIFVLCSVIFNHKDLIQAADVWNEWDTISAHR